MFLFECIFFVLPISIVIGSLLTVRSCGFRLVPKSLAVHLDEQSAPAEAAGPLAT
jgi:hypothetical protein